MALICVKDGQNRLSILIGDAHTHDVRSGRNSILVYRVLLCVGHDHDIFLFEAVVCCSTHMVIRCTMSYSKQRRNVTYQSKYP